MHGVCPQNKCCSLHNECGTDIYHCNLSLGCKVNFPFLFYIFIIFILLFLLYFSNRKSGVCVREHNQNTKGGICNIVLISFLIWSCHHLNTLMTAALFFIALLQRNTLLTTYKIAVYYILYFLFETFSLLSCCHRFSMWHFFHKYKTDVSSRRPARYMTPFYNRESFIA